MKSLGKVSIIGMLIALVGIAALPLDASAQTRKRPVIRKKTVVKRTAAPAVKLYTVTGGKRVHARMNDTISSKTAHVGQTFSASTTEPVYSSTGVVVIPEGSELTGRVDAVVAAQKGGKPGTIDVSFTRVRLPNGTTRRINGSLTDLYTDDAKSDVEGTATGDKMKHRKIIFIGGGGAGGAVLGGAIGGGKGALIGGIIGAAGGFLGERYTKGEEAEVRSGTEFGVIINQAISLPRYAEVPEP
ncbi:MAG TPA: hypothetical protein VJV05_10415 [Pyrinomonadaceae bacterium]|nr:hypothetical protein [Pyrinomonadaceae bacterium]